MALSVCWEASLDPQIGNDQRTVTNSYESKLHVAYGEIGPKRRAAVRRAHGRRDHGGADESRGDGLAP